MSTNTKQRCYNCDSSINDEDKFCASCGQKNTTGRTKLRQLISDFVAEEFNLNNKLLKTLLHIFIPGKLSEQHFSGKHKSYISPIKFFFITAILAITVISLIPTEFTKEDSVMNNIARYNGRVQALHEMDSLHLIHVDTTTYPSLGKVLQQISDSLWQDTKYKDEDTELVQSDSIYMPLNIDVNYLGQPLPKIKATDLETLTSKELIEKYMAEDFTQLEQMILAQLLKATASPEKWIQFIIEKIAIGLFLMMPLLALFLKALYFRKDIYYVEHLIFSFHYHSFMLLFITFFGIVDYFTKDGLDDVWYLLSIIVLFIYSLIAMKRIYKQNWAISLLKLCIIFLFYCLLLLIFALLTTVFSFIFF